MEVLKSDFSDEQLSIAELVLAESDPSIPGVNLKQFMHDHPKLQEAVQNLAGNSHAIRRQDNEYIRVSGMIMRYIGSGYAQQLYHQMSNVFDVLRAHSEAHMEEQFEFDQLRKVVDEPVEAVLTYLGDIPQIITGSPIDFPRGDERWLVVDLSILRYSSLDQLVYQFTGPSESSSLEEMGIEAEPMQETEVSPEQTTSAVSDGVGRTPQYVDSIANVDQLGREPFARYLAHHLQDLWNGNVAEHTGRGKEGSVPKEKDRKSREVLRGKSFLVNLYGKWGTGKTTFTDFLMGALNKGETGTKWITVEFNAWKQQEVEPVWWPLLDTVIRGSIQQQSWDNRLRLRLRYFVWRTIRTNTIPICIGFFIAAVLLIAPWFAKDGGLNDYQPFLKLFAALSAGVGVVSSFVGGFFLNSPRSAEIFKQLQRDPVQDIREYFVDFVKRLDAPVLVFVDDIDRCRSDYAVALLEQLHIVFSSPRVFFLVAGDRHWISTSFEKSYGDMGKDIEEAGRSIGYMFLEKIFQLSFGLPSISGTTRKNYMTQLTSARSAPPSVRLETEESKVQAEFSSANSDAEVFKTEQRLLTEGFDAKTVSNQMMIRARSNMVAVEREHRLVDLVSWVLPNPRLMKLIVSAYGIYIYLYRDLNTPETKYDYFSQIAIWTVVMVSFSRLADYLEENPDQLSLLFDEQRTRKYPADIEKMLTSPDVRRGFEDNSAMRLSEQFLRDLNGRY